MKNLKTFEAKDARFELTIFDDGVVVIEDHGAESYFNTEFKTKDSVVEMGVYDEYIRICTAYYTFQGEGPGVTIEVTESQFIELIKFYRYRKMELTKRKHKSKVTKSLS